MFRLFFRHESHWTDFSHPLMKNKTNIIKVKHTTRNSLRKLLFWQSLGVFLSMAFYTRDEIKGMQKQWRYVYLDKCIDCHNCHVRLWLGIVHEVQVHQLFQLQVVCLHTVDHIRKERTEISFKIVNKWYTHLVHASQLIQENCGTLLLTHCKAL